MYTTSSIILAAGKGTRMKSSLPKVLHPLAGQAMLGWVVNALIDAEIDHHTVVLSEDLEPFKDFLKHHPQLTVAVQKARQGTGDAVAAASCVYKGVKKPSFARGFLFHGQEISADSVLICTGDTPALEPTILKEFIAQCRTDNTAIGLLGMQLSEPRGYGRCITKEEKLIGIVEERDATPEERRINVCNTGIFYAKTSFLFELVDQLTTENAQKEYYLTDCVGLAHTKGYPTKLVVAPNPSSFFGINDREQLAQVEGILIKRSIKSLMDQGVSFQLPETCYLEPSIICGADTLISPSTYLAGSTKIGASCRIHHGAHLENCILGDRVEIGAGSILKNVRIASYEKVPPLSVKLG